MCANYLYFPFVKQKIYKIRTTMEFIESLQRKLGIDMKDLKIMSLIIRNPDISQSEIAKKLKITQPSVNIRIKKLKQRGIIQFNAGFNLNETNLSVVKVDFTATNPTKILENIEKCPFFINGFVTSGKNNASLLLMHSDLKKIDDIINNHIRSKKEVSEINTAIVIHSIGKFILSIDLDRILTQNNSICKECPEICPLST